MSHKAMRRLTHYERQIILATQCTIHEVAEVEDTMRHIIFHSTLDWVDADTFNKGAREAYSVVKAMGRRKTA